jgi:hypothetical protein
LARYAGINAVVIALLWVPLEYGLTRLSNLNNIFLFPETNSVPLLKISSLFGVLMVSFVVVFVNSSLVVIFSDASERGRRSGTAHGVNGEAGLFAAPRERSINGLLFNNLGPRAPPRRDQDILLSRY